jgi:hypothetical protein
VGARDTGDPVVLDEGVLATLEVILGAKRAAELSIQFEARLRQAAQVISADSPRQEVAREAHNVVSLAGQFGCLELVDRARQLHHALRAAEVVDIGPMRAAVTDAALRAISAVRFRYPR